jgi:lipoate-protein ligase A
LSFSDDTAFQEAVRRLSSRAITAESALGRPPSWDEAAQAFVEAFSSSLFLDFFTSDLTPEESQRATELAKDKYSSPGWTFRI